MFALTWTALHKIDEKSPFYGKDAMQKLRDQRCEIFLSIRGLDETISQTIHARFRYSLDDIDYFGIVDGEHVVYLVPAAVVGGMTSMSTRAYQEYRVAQLTM